jgi:hypothetical protein
MMQGGGCPKSSARGGRRSKGKAFYPFSPRKRGPKPRLGFARDLRLIRGLSLGPRLRGEDGVSVMLHQGPRRAFGKSPQHLQNLPYPNPTASHGKSARPATELAAGGDRSGLGSREIRDRSGDPGVAGPARRRRGANGFVETVFFLTHPDVVRTLRSPFHNSASDRVRPMTLAPSALRAPPPGEGDRQAALRGASSDPQNP